MTERTEYEPTPERTEVGYEQYREIADALNPAFRKTGIVDAAGYDRAVRDPRTVKLRIGEGATVMEVPFLTPVEHVDGYEPEHAKSLMDSRDVFVMTLPMVALTDARIVQPEQDKFLPARSAILVETEHSETSDAKQILPELLRELGPHQPEDFLDTRIEDPELQPASMAMYEARFEAIDEHGEAIPPTGKSYQEAFEEIVRENHPLVRRTKLLDAERLRNDEQAMNELWGLCKDRFKWLRDNHPVWLEDTKDFFRSMVLGDGAHTIDRYNDDDKSSCLGFFLSSYDECFWIKDEKREAAAKAAKERGDQMIYFYGMANDASSSMHYSKDVVQLLSLICNKMGGTYTVTFESTNMSGQYIPPIVMNYVEQSGSLKITEPVHKTDQVDYWYLKPVTVD